MKKLFLIPTMILLVFATANAQERKRNLSFELRPTISFSTTKLAGDDLNMGKGFEAIFNYRLSDQLSAYLGWGWNQFSSDQSQLGDNLDFEETGYVFGVQFSHPLGDSPIEFIAQAGGIYDHIEIENTDGEIIHDTGHGLGYQLFTGVAYSMGSGWKLKPGIKYQSLHRELNTNSNAYNLNLRYLSLGLGISKSI